MFVCMYVCMGVRMYVCIISSIIIIPRLRLNDDPDAPARAFKEMIIIIGYCCDYYDHDYIHHYFILL